MPSQIDVIDSHIASSEREKYNELLALEIQQSNRSYWKFSTVTGVFKQSLTETNEATFDYSKERFGLNLESWDKVFDYVHELNATAESDNVRYKVLFLARHGQGYHNLAHSQYGDDAWNNYWSKLTGDGKIVWGPDALLTNLGLSQAHKNGELWNQEIAKGLKVPQRWFVSPLSRSIDTMIHTWTDLDLVDLKTVRPLVMENIREQMGVHTCDKRLPRSVIDYKYCPLGIEIEDGFVEQDIYYQDDYRESTAEQAIRLNKSLQDIWGKYTTKEESNICITSHSGSIRSLLLVLGHRPFAIGTGGVIPVLVKGEFITNEQ
ncbi:uncharacterized protein KQ657_001279 [Scheffersomyces spartinae]|uniref:Phosphoglycerate mutase n=1 Tax=Scheffersomyces spartinae TaxID=45513 RepID=A0A9P8AHS7_9ASCO|nr:uncharacterized protein KQ657_001279 [Scheffersomyces spartinae]KAG7192822.1 hypothetical protein KQ657_001279 [Scheffersomyces spartinae]